MAVGGALEIVGGGAHKGPGDDAPHGVGAGEHFAGDVAQLVQAFQGDDGFVGGDLKHAVAGGVHDGLAGAQMFFAQLHQNLGAGGGLVAQHV